MDHRRTAAAWHVEEGSPLDGYARTGKVVGELLGEIEDCLAIVERGEIDIELDPVEEHQRLTALLHHVQPEWAKQRARTAGRWFGAGPAESWVERFVGGRSDAEAAAAARQLLQSIDDGDPAVVDHGTSWDRGDVAEIHSDWGWREPDRDDPAHGRWAAAQAGVTDAYASAFVETFWEAVVVACRRELTVTAATPAGPHHRQSAGTDRAMTGPSAHGSTERAVSPPDGSARLPFVRAARSDWARERSDGVPDGWITERIGRWGHDDAEVVYNARRYEVMLTSSRAADDVVAGLEASGWERHGEAGSRTFWTRDRIAATRAALARVDHDSGRDRTVSAGRSDEAPERFAPAGLDRGLAL